MTSNQVALRRTVKTEAGGWQYTLEEYNRIWVARVKTRIVIDAQGCWIWQGFINPASGYGTAPYRGHKTVPVHRKMYEITHGVLLNGRKEYACHSCDKPLCCNPAHLWVGSSSDNQKDSVRKGRHPKVRLTHCPQGHEYSPENTRINNSGPGPSRTCKTCEKIRHNSPEYIAWRRKYQARRRAAKRAARDRLHGRAA